MDIDSLEHLLSIESIRQLKARYCRWIDTKQWQRLPELFTDDCTFDGMGWGDANADVHAFVSGVSRRHATTLSVHHVHPCEIVLTSANSARGIWAMEDFVEWQGPDALREGGTEKGFRGYGHYEEEYRKVGKDWKISFLRLTRLRIDPVPADAPPARKGQRQASPGWLEEGRGAS